MRPERWPAAGTGGQTHQDLPRVPKSFFSGVEGSALEVLGIKRQYASNSFVPADETDRKWRICGGVSCQSASLTLTFQAVGGNNWFIYDTISPVWPNLTELSFFFLCNSPPGNRQLQLPQARGHHASVRQRRPQLRDGDAEQVEVWGLPAQRLHHPGGHRGEEDVLHPAWRRERHHQVQQGDEADRRILLWRYILQSHVLFYFLFFSIIDVYMNYIRRHWHAGTPQTPSQTCIPAACSYTYILRRVSPAVVRLMPFEVKLLWM